MTEDNAVKIILKLIESGEIKLNVYKNIFLDKSLEQIINTCTDSEKSMPYKGESITKKELSKKGMLCAAAMDAQYILCLLEILKSDGIEASDIVKVIKELKLV